MNRIKFSHNYLKFPSAVGNGSRVRLVGIQFVFLEYLTKEFIEKDTAYIDENQHIAHYELPKKGEFLLLTFRHGKWEFSTLRRLTYEKMKYYAYGLGEEFEVVVENEKHKN